MSKMSLQAKKQQHAARQAAIDNAKVKRNTARAVFKASYHSISHALQSKEMPNFALRDLQKQIEDQFQDCKTFNAELLELLSFESAESEMQWIAKIQTYYHEIIEQIVVKYTNVEEQEQIKQESGAKSSFLQLEKVKCRTLMGNYVITHSLKEISTNKSCHKFVQGIPHMCYALVLEKNPKAW